MSDVAAFLVVLDKRIHPDTAVATMDAVRQLKGVVGIRTIYNDAGEEIRVIRGIMAAGEAQLQEDRLRIAAEVAAEMGVVEG